MAFHRRFDRALPSLPLPSLDTLEDALVRRKVSADDPPHLRADYARMVKTTFSLLDFPASQAALAARADEDDHAWWNPRGHGDTFGIRPADPYFRAAGICPLPLVSFALTWVATRHAPTGDDAAMLDRATRLCLTMMDVRARIFSGRWEQDTELGKPLNMLWYEKLFNASVLVHAESCELATAPEPRSRHVAVMVRGAVIFVTPAAGYWQLHAQLTRALAIGRDASSASAVRVGIPSADHIAEQLRFRLELEEASPENHDASISLRDAAFVLCLDDDRAPEAVGERMHALQAGNFANRFYNKSINVVVFADGEAGVVGNYFSGMTGTVSTQLAALVQREAEAIEVPPLTSEAPVDVRAVRWDDPDGDLARKCDAAERRFLTHEFPASPFKRGPRNDVHVLRGNVGRKTFKDRGVIPGGAFQAALELTLFDFFGGPSSIWEIVHLRHTRYGGMTFVEAAMSSMQSFARSAAAPFREGQTPSGADADRLRVSLRKGIDEYKRDAIGYKRGDAWMWHLDALLRESGMPSRLREQRQEDEPRAITERRSAYMWSVMHDLLPGAPQTVTSNPWKFPEIAAVGRCGVFCLLPPQTMAMHYLFDAERTTIVPNANTAHPCYGREPELADKLSRALELVTNLLG